VGPVLAKLGKKVFMFLGHDDADTAGYSVKLTNPSAHAPRHGHIRGNPDRVRAKRWNTACRGTFASPQHVYTRTLLAAVPPARPSTAGS